MVSLTSVDSTVFLLPEDGPTARETFLSLLHNPGESYLSMFGFTDGDTIREIEAADADGVKIHLLLDRSQAAGHTEAPVIHALAAALTHGDITITTAGVGSKTPGQIWHDKSLVVRAVDGGEDHVFFSSVNDSGGGWSQGNSAIYLRSNILAAAMIQRFAIHSAWGRTHEPQSQIWPIAISPGSTVTVETEANVTTVSTDAPASVTVTSP